MLFRSLVHGTHKGLATVAHSGGDAGYRAHLVRFPEQRFSVACLCNLGTVNPGGQALKAADIYLNLPEPKPAAPADSPVIISAADLARFPGLYWNRDGDAVRRIALREGRLHLSFVAGDDNEMKPTGPARFRLAGPPLEYRFDPDGRLAEQSPGSAKPDYFERAAEFTPTPAQLNEYTGAYLSDEIESIYRIVLDKDRLDRKSTRLNSSHIQKSRMPSSA